VPVGCVYTNLAPGMCSVRGSSGVLVMSIDAGGHGPGDGPITHADRITSAGSLVLGCVVYPSGHRILKNKSILFLFMKLKHQILLQVVKNSTLTAT